MVVIPILFPISIMVGVVIPITMTMAPIPIFPAFVIPALAQVAMFSPALSFPAAIIVVLADTPPVVVTVVGVINSIRAPLGASRSDGRQGQRRGEQNQENVSIR
jgi:hypothetical protein